MDRWRGVLELINRASPLEVFLLRDESRVFDAMPPGKDEVSRMGRGNG